MNDKRFFKTSLMTIAIQSLLYVLVIVIFFALLSITNPAMINISRTAAITATLFVVVLLILTLVYGGLDINTKKRRTVVSSISISTFFTDVLTYLLLQIMNVNPQNPEANTHLILVSEDLLLLVCAMVIQFAVIYGLTTLTYYYYYLINPPENCIIITSTQELGNQVYKKLKPYFKRYKINEIVHYSCKDIKKTIQDNQAIFLAGIPDTEEASLESYCYKHNKSIYLMAELEDVIISSATQNIFDDMPFLNIHRTQPTLLQLIGKRIIDILCSAIGLIITSPIILIVSIIIKLSDDAPIFFIQKRATRNGKIFNIIKFRTMYFDTKSNYKQTSATEDDSRITPIGKFLRKYRIDELPQLLNVLKGDMSVVGPRPEMLENVDRYTREVPEFRYRQQMKAGITGLAQIEGKYNTSPKEKVILDLLYIENFSLSYDLKLILRTLTIFFRRDSTEPFKVEKKEELLPMRILPN